MTQDYTVSSVAKMIKELLGEEEEKARNPPPRPQRHILIQDPSRSKSQSNLKDALQAVEALYERQKRRDSKVQLMKNLRQKSQNVKPFKVSNPISALINQEKRLKPIQQRVGDILHQKEKKMLLHRIMKEEAQLQSSKNAHRDSMKESSFLNDTNYWYDQKVLTQLQSKERKLEEKRLELAQRQLQNLKLTPQINNQSQQHFDNYLRKNNLEDLGVVQRLQRQIQRSKVYKQRIREQVLQNQTPFKPKLYRKKSSSALKTSKSGSRMRWQNNSSTFHRESLSRQRENSSNSKVFLTYQTNQQLFNRLQKQKQLKNGVRVKSPKHDDRSLQDISGLSSNIKTRPQSFIQTLASSNLLPKSAQKYSAQKPSAMKQDKSSSDVKRRLDEVIFKNKGQVLMFVEQLLKKQLSKSRQKKGKQSLKQSLKQSTHIKRKNDRMAIRITPPKNKQPARKNSPSKSRSPPKKTTPNKKSSSPSPIKMRESSPKRRR